jgi:hypothetical protein
MLCSTIGSYSTDAYSTISAVHNDSVDTGTAVSSTLFSVIILLCVTISLALCTRILYTRVKLQLISYVPPVVGACVRVCTCKQILHAKAGEFIKKNRSTLPAMLLPEEPQMRK